jgi:hypothetical protein
VVAKKRGRVSRKKEISLIEFRAWLEGVEELQPSDWAPDATQWKLIRDKINKVVESTTPPPAPEVPIMQSEFNTNGVTMAPEVSGGVPSLPIVVVPPESASAFGTERTPSKTPNVGGDYQSTFV